MLQIYLINIITNSSELLPRQRRQPKTNVVNINIRHFKFIVMPSSSRKGSNRYHVECLKCNKKYDSEYHFTHSSKSHDGKKVKFVRFIDSQQPTMKTFLQKKTNKCRRK